jgi:O-acetylserine/cysteine efflux transporter
VAAQNGPHKFAMAASTPSRFTALDWTLAIAVVTVWGLNFLVAKFTLEHLSAPQLGLLRFLFAALPLILFVRLPRVPPRFVVLYGLVQGFAQFACLSAAMKLGLSAGMAAVLMQMQVLFTPIIAWGSISERLTGRNLVAGALGIAAVAALLLPRAPGAHEAPVMAILLVLGASISWSLSNVLLRGAARRNEDLAVVPLMGWSAAAAVPAFALLSLAVDEQPLFSNPATLRWDVLAACACLGWASTTAAYVMWGKLLQRHSAGRVAPLSLGVPLVGVAGGIAFCDERLTAMQAAAAFVMLAALIVAVWPFQSRGSNA